MKTSAPTHEDPVAPKSAHSETADAPSMPSAGTGRGVWLWVFNWSACCWLAGAGSLGAAIGVVGDALLVAVPLQ